MSAGEAKQPTGDKPPIPVRPSAIQRHQLNLTTRSTRVDKVNTAALPGIDVAEEIRLINQGLAQRVGDSRYKIKNRIYVVKPNGATYPESGAGIISIRRPVMIALRELIRQDGLTPSFTRATERDPTYNADIIREALDLFELWKGGEQDVRR